MWWLYFDDSIEDELGNKNKSFIWGYGHYLVYAFATAVGVLISVNVDVITNHAKIEESHAIAGLAIVIAGYLISVWLCHDFILEKKGIKLFELLILALLILGIGFVFQNILMMSLVFVAMITIRVIREHKQCIS